MFPLDAFFVVLCLFQLEDVVNKELLQILVAKVDAQLLKTVDLETLKTKDVKYSNG